MIYFLKVAEFNSPVKIGFVNESRSVLERIKSLQPGNPYTLELIMLMPGSMEVEKQIHRKYEGLRLCGEWFKSKVLVHYGICPRCANSILDHPRSGVWIRCFDNKAYHVRFSWNNLGAMKEPTLIASPFQLPLGKLRLEEFS